MLAIETSCDETSVSVLKGKQVLSNVTISQISQHQKFGGVVPNLAANLHLINVTKVLEKSLKKAKIGWEDIDCVAYTKEPGLSLCLQIGEVIAHTVSLYLEKKLFPINHLQGHAYSTLIQTEKEWEFPVLFFLVSGGHTQLCLLKDHFSWEVVGDTKDDTLGECLDKTAVLFGYDYPGGPIIEQLAKSGKNSYQLTVPKNDKTLEFSFSGLKSQVSRLVKKEEKRLKVADLACSLQLTLLQVMKKKISNALKKYGQVKSVASAGGVMANHFFCSSLNEFLSPKFSLFLPKKQFSTDNAAMIGMCAYYRYLRKKKKG